MYLHYQLYLHHHQLHLHHHYYHCCTIRTGLFPSFSKGRLCHLVELSDLILMDLLGYSLLRKVCSLTPTRRLHIVTYSLQPPSDTLIIERSIIHTLSYSTRRRETILKRVVFHLSSSLSSPNPSLRFHHRLHLHHHRFERFRVN